MIYFDIHHFLWSGDLPPQFLNEQGATRSAASMGEEPLAVLECQQPVLFSCSEGKGMTTFIISFWHMALCCQDETGTQGFQEYKKHAKRSRIRTNLMYFNTVASWSSTPRNRISFAPPTPFLWVPLQNCSASDSRIFPGHVLDLCWIRQRSEFTMQMSRQSSLDCELQIGTFSWNAAKVSVAQWLPGSSEGFLKAPNEVLLVGKRVTSKNFQGHQSYLPKLMLHWPMASVFCMYLLAPWPRVTFGLNNLDRRHWRNCGVKWWVDFL